MAHPCFDCGGECYCHGDIDDTITSHTPAECEGCDCCQMMEESKEDYWQDDDEYIIETEDDEDEDEIGILFISG